ncbi:MAG: hypothetical protein OXB88_04550 [Bacteriovoracales bacterium]|nr:hypothetical protein [Bacteriovoracales bacterium]
MMKTKALFLTVVLSLMWGCKTFKGQLEVFDDLQLTDARGRSHVVKSGTYKAKWTLKNEKKRLVRLRLKGVDWKRNFLFEYPEGVDLSAEGDFEFITKQGDRLFGIRGNNTKTVNTSAPIRGEETCSVHDYGPYYGPGYHHGPGYYDCGFNGCYHDAYFGTRSVIYRVRSEVTESRFQLMGNQEPILGDFTGKHVRQERLYDYYGPCSYPYYPYSPYSHPHYYSRRAPYHP